MKKTLHIFGIVLLLTGLVFAFSSCKPEKQPDNLVLSASVDTTGLAAFQSWKQMNETKDASKYYIEGYKDALNSQSVSPAKTKVVYKAPAKKAATSAVQPVKKKGWSKAAKGTVIGTTAGALAGVLINKKDRVAGGIIGGILGGGIGYGVGYSMDKKDGRY